MRERFKTLKKELNDLIKEKRKLFNNKTGLIKEEKNDLNIELNKKTNGIDIFHFLDLKHNILNDTLKKLTIILQNQISENNKEETNYIKYIKNIKNNVKRELLNDDKNLENELHNIKMEYNNYIQNYNNYNGDYKVNQGENYLDNDNISANIGQLINLLDKNKRKEENNIAKIKKELNLKLDKINKEIKNDRNKLNFIDNNQIKKCLDNINNELDKGKSYEYLKRNEYKETINSILNDILMKLEIEK